MTWSLSNNCKENCLSKEKQALKTGSDSCNINCAGCPFGIKFRPNLESKCLKFWPTVLSVLTFLLQKNILYIQKSISTNKKTPTLWVIWMCFTCTRCPRNPRNSPGFVDRALFSASDQAFCLPWANMNIHVHLPCIDSKSTFGLQFFSLALALLWRFFTCKNVYIII